MTLAATGGRPDSSSKTGPNQIAESTYVRSSDAPNSGEVQPVRLGGRAGGLSKLLGRDENKRQLITAGSRLLQVQLFTIDVYIPSQQLWFGFWSTRFTSMLPYIATTYRHIHTRGPLYLTQDPIIRRIVRETT